MRRRVLVTGGAGFIGSHVVRRLSAEGWAVTVVDDLSMGQRMRVPAEVTFVEADVGDRSAVTAACAGVDAVIHLAARVSVRASVQNFYEDAQTNLMGTLTVLRACLTQGVRRLVFASSMAVYADTPEPVPIAEDYPTRPLSPYGIAKRAAEEYCLQLGAAGGLETVVLRYFNTFGPGQTFTPYVGVVTIFVRRLLAGEAPMIYGDGEQRRDFVHVEDVSRATVRALDGDVAGQILNVGTGVPTSFNQILRMVEAALGTTLRPTHVPVERAELRNSIADISRARRLLGYAPEQRLEEGIRHLVEAYRGAPPNAPPHTD
jgi:UDP-glucose 4-epimerase